MTAKDFHEKLVFLKRELRVPGDSVAAKQRASAPAEYIIRALLGFLLSRATIFSSVAPFGAAITAAAPVGAPGAVTLLGALFGYMLMPGTIQPLKYMAISVLISAVIHLCRGTPFSEKKWFPPLTAAAVTASIGFIYAIDAGWTAAATARYAADVLLAGGAAYFYRVAMSSWDGTDSQAETKHAVSVILLLATALAAVSGILLFRTISVGRIISVLIIMLSAFRGGIAYGCASACAVGLLMDATGSAVPYYTLLYAFCALVSGAFTKQGRVMFLASYILADAVAVVWLWNVSSSASAMYEVFIASVAFAVLPSRTMARMTILIPANTKGYGVLKAREYAKSRVELAAGAFRDLYDTVRISMNSGVNDSSISTVFEAAAESVCRQCRRSPECWQARFNDTQDIMNNLTPLLRQQGTLRPADFPQYFAEKCASLAEFASAVNAEYKAMQVRRRYKTLLSENRITAYGQYADFSTVLRGLACELGSDIGFDPETEHKLQKFLRSADIDASAAVFRDRGGRLHAELSGGGLYLLRRDQEFLNRLSGVVGMRLCCSEERSSSGRMILLEAEPLCATVGIASLRKKGQSACGDSGTYFKTDEGLLYILLSDGMGAGSDAARYSMDAVRILEKFLRAGVQPELAMRILNDQMLLRNATDTVAATVDLMCIDLFSGETRLFKYGAAPTYVRRGDTVRRIRSRNLAAGLGSCIDGSPELVRLRLEPGNFAVVLTDGVINGAEDRWLREVLADCQGESAREMARSILESAMKNTGRDDDMTVITICISTRL